MPARSRVRGEHTKSQWVRTQSTWVSSTSQTDVVSSGSSAAMAGTLEMMTDVVNPNFRKVRAKGSIVNTPMTRSSDRRSSSFSGLTTTGINSSYTGKKNSESFVGDIVTAYCGIPAIPPVSVSTMDNLVTLAATTARAGVESPEVQGQVFLAELLKTIKMLMSPMNGLRQFILGWMARRRNPRYKGGPSVVTTVASCWLEARYGWRPFILEVEAILSTLQKGNPTLRKTSRGQAEHSYETQELLPRVGTISNGYHFDILAQYTYDIKVRSGILYDSKMDVGGQFGMRWADLPSTAWELVPFSFVVDWFISVGDYISALTPKGGVRHLAEFETISVKSTVVWTCTKAYHPSQSSAVVTTPSGTCERTVETFMRRPKVSPPGISWASSLEDAFRGLRKLDALGLLIQLLLSGKRR